MSTGSATQALRFHPGVVFPYFVYTRVNVHRGSIVSFSRPIMSMRHLSQQSAQNGFDSKSDLATPYSHVLVFVIELLPSSLT